MGPETRLPARWRWLPPLVIAMAAIVPYLHVLHAPFVFDDVKLVKENKLLRTGWERPSEVVEIFDVTSRRWDAEELRPNYRPLRFLSYLVDYRLARAWYGQFPEDDPPVFFFHLTNVILHALNALLVFSVARSLARVLSTPAGNADGRLPAFLGLSAALIFALHPLQTEAVTYISGRRDVLAAFFYLAAVALHLRAGPFSAPGPIELVGIPLLLVCGLLSKEMAVTLPAALILIDLACRARWSWRRAILHGVNLALAAVLVKVTLSNPGLLNAAPGEGPLATALDACRFVARYLGLCILPASQSVDYSFDAIPVSSGVVSPWTALPAVALVLGLAFIGGRALLRVVRGCASSPWCIALPIGIFWFLGTLTPVLQIVPIAERFAERFAYIPCLGVILIAALAIVRLRDFEPILGWGLLVLLCVLGFAGTVRRNCEWQTPLAIWTSAVEAQPRAARAHLGRANALKDASMFREASQEYSDAIAIFGEKPDVPLHHGFLLQALAMRGGVYALLASQEPALLDAAISDYRSVLAMTDTDGIAIEPSAKHTVLHFDLAGLHARQGDKDSAAREYRRVIEIGSPVALVGASYYYLGKIALGNANPAAAAELLEKAYDVIPVSDPAKLTVAVELVDLLIDQKELDAASRAVSRALAGGATQRMRLHLLTREAKILDRRGDLSGCMAKLQSILAVDPSYPPALLSLAGIEAATGRHEEAEKHYEAVLAVDRNNAEALKGLQNAKLLRKIEEGKAGKPPEPDSAQVLDALEKKGLASLEKGQLLAAREELSSLVNRATAAKSKEYQLKGLRGLATVEEKLGQWKKTEQTLRAALELAPADGGLLFQLGEINFRHMDDRAAARRFFERYLEALPAGKNAEPRALIDLGELLGASDPNGALGLLEKARAAGHEEAELDRAFGYRHADAGHWKESLDAFNRYFERTQPLDAGGREDTARKAARDFVRQSVLPRVAE